MAGLAAARLSGGSEFIIIIIIIKRF